MFLKDREPTRAREVDGYSSLMAWEEEGIAVGVSLVGGGWNNFRHKDSNSWQSQGSTYP